MALSNPITSYGICMATIRDLDTGDLYPIRILGDIDPDLTQELVDLRGGCAAFPWASAPGEASGEIALEIKQYDPGVLKFFSPSSSTSVVENSSGEASGNFTALTDVVGTSMSDAVAGIASIAEDPAGTALYGDYIIKATGAATFDIYVDNNISGQVFIDDTMKITSAAITNPGTGATVVSQGLEFTAGSGAAAFVTGDVARFSVRPVNTYSLIHQIGKVGATPKEFALTIYAESIDGKGGKMIRSVKYPRLISSGGAGLKFKYKDWASFETTCKILQDSVLEYAGQEEFINR